MKPESLDDIIDKYSKPMCTGMYGPCHKEGTRRRQNTKYVNEEDNYVTMCDECFDLNEEYWADMWSDYWGGVL